MTKVLSLLAAATLFLGSCSISNKVAQQKDYNDDVYYSEARATEMQLLTKADQDANRKREESIRQEQVYGYNDYYPGSIYFYATPWRPYSYNRFYDPFFDPFAFNNFGYNNYGYNNYGYNNYYGYNSWYSSGYNLGAYNPWLYSNPYGSIYGNPNSVSLPYTYYPGYNYGRYTGPSGFYNDPNYRARPSRGGENIGGLAKIMETVRMDGQGVIMTGPSRGEVFERGNITTSSTGTTSSTPAATSTSRARPARTPSVDPGSINNTQPNNYPTRAQPQVQSSPPPSSSGNSYGGGSSSGSSSSSDDRARPARVGN